MPVNFSDQFFKDLHYCVSCIFPVLKIFQTESVDQMHIPGVQFSQDFQIAAAPVFFQKDQVLKPLSFTVRYPQQVILGC